MIHSMPSAPFPLVSVIMPAYNVEAYIAKAIQAILDQTYRNFELIVSDDGSKDDTASIINSFSDPRIVRLSNLHNKGYADNMNALFRAAKGQFLVIQDADDYCTENRLQVLLDFLTLHENIDVVGSSYIKVDEHQKEEQVTMPVSETIIVQSFQEMSDPLPVLNGTVMFKRKIIDQGFFFRKLKYINRGQDDDWLFRISEHFTLANVPQYLYYYRCHSSSMTQNPAHHTYYSIFAGKYVRFLKQYRMNHKEDLLEQNNWSEIEIFFKTERDKLISTQPAFLELYIAHQYLALDRRLIALKWLFKALLKDPLNPYIWKKMSYVVLGKA